ncbi:MAG: DNA polymerase III subunit delta [bacterium]|nr:DNA polymerase III subunit delta [bacterium]
MASNQIHFIVGPNRFCLVEERIRWTRTFIEKHGEENLLRIDAKKASFSDIESECTTAPFIAPKRLVVVEGMPRGKKGDIAHILKTMHQDTILLFVLESDIGKRAKLTVPSKELYELATIKECPSLNHAKQLQWITARFAANNARVIPSAVGLLLDSVGDDQALIAQEIDKISMYCTGKDVTDADIELLVATSAEREAWKLMDILGEGKPEVALQYVHTLLDKGFSPQALWSTYLWMLSVIIDIAAYVQGGETNPWNIAKEIRANPMGIKAMLPYAKQLDKAVLKRILDFAIDADKGIKTGKYRATAESPEELLALIDRSILSFI